jgi:hypothetical protein
LRNSTATGRFLNFRAGAKVSAGGGTDADLAALDGGDEFDELMRAIAAVMLELGKLPSP